MRDSAGRWLIVENVMLKYFKVTLNVFEFSNVKKIVESWLVYGDKFHESSSQVFWRTQ